MQGKGLLSRNYCMDLTLYFLCPGCSHNNSLIAGPYPVLCMPLVDRGGGNAGVVVPIPCSSCFVWGFCYGIWVRNRDHHHPHMHRLLGIPCMGPPPAVDWVVWYSAFCFFLRQIAFRFFLSRSGGKVFLEFCDVGDVADEMQPCNF